MLSVCITTSTLIPRPHLRHRLVTVSFEHYFPTPRTGNRTIRFLNRRSEHFNPVHLRFIVGFSSDNLLRPLDAQGLGLAETIIGLDEQKDQLKKDETALRTLLGEMMHMCLWGNATVDTQSSLRSIIVDTLINVVFQDLSLLTNITHADIQQIQTVSKSEQTDRARYILKDDGPLAWDLLNRVRQDKSGVSRVDFILDNGEWPLSASTSIHIELPSSRIRG